MNGPAFLQAAPADPAGPAITVSFGGTPCAAFTVNSATRITATVPDEAASGPLSVTTDDGDAASVNAFIMTGSWTCWPRSGRQALMLGWPGPEVLDHFCISQI
jgi:hypothetical protein